MRRAVATIFLLGVLTIDGGGGEGCWRAYVRLSLAGWGDAGKGVLGGGGTPMLLIVTGIRNS